MGNFFKPYPSRAKAGFVCIGSFMHLFTRVKKINDTYDILPFLGVKVALRV
jgi:hypothetical protein